MRQPRKKRGEDKVVCILHIRPWEKWFLAEKSLNGI
jgi:hypothetical protein